MCRVVKTALVGYFSYGALSFTNQFAGILQPYAPDEMLCAYFEQLFNPAAQAGGAHAGGMAELLHAEYIVADVG